MINCTAYYIEDQTPGTRRRWGVLFQFDDGVTVHKEIRVSRSTGDEFDARDEMMYLFTLKWKEAKLDWLFYHRGTLSYRDRKIFDPLFRLRHVKEVTYG